MRHVSFDFATSHVPSLATVRTLIAADKRLSGQRRAGILSSLSALARWIDQDPATVPFVAPVIESAFDRLRADVLGVSRKRLKNARADVRFALRRIGGSSRYLAPFSPEAQRLWDLLDDKYARCSLSRLLRFLSAQGIPPASINDAVSNRFLEALRREGRLRLKPETCHQSAIRLWNRAGAKFPAWPQVTLTIPTYRQRTALPWSAFPERLEQEVDRFLTSGEAAESIFDGPTHRPLKPTTKRTQKVHICRAAAALVKAGIAPQELSCLRSLCQPIHFRRALERIIEDRKGVIGGYVMGLAWTLVKLARYGGQSTSEEIAVVNQLHLRLATRRRGETPKDLDRDQEALRLLDDPRRFDALLTLPKRTAERMVKSKMISRAQALEIQKACALEIWFCAPLRVSNFAALRLDQHFLRITLDGRKRVVVRIAASEVKNCEALEFILTEDAIALLDLYITKYRPLLVTGPTPWLFPGRKDCHKGSNSIRGQLSCFVNDSIGIGFHPHLIRKIFAKIYLDAEPGGIEVVRRGLGHRDARTTRLVYAQHQNRAANLKYNKALECRKLAALRQGLLP